MPTRVYWVYVLRNSTGKYYVGLTSDLVRRLDDHNCGRSRWTAKYRPWEMIWARGPMTLTEARVMEGRLKRQKGGNGLFALLGLSRSSGS